jgi:hypothetical protein
MPYDPTEFDGPPSPNAVDPAGDLLKKICVNCIRWEGKDGQERGYCQQLNITTARLGSCRLFVKRP